MEPTSSERLPVEAEQNAAARIRAMREAYGWSTAALAERMTEAGHPINQSAVWRIESGEPRRRINLDEAVGFAKVFGITVERLISPPDDAITEHLNSLINTYIATWRAADAARRGAASLRAAIDAILADHPDLREHGEARLSAALEAEQHGTFAVSLPPPAWDESQGSIPDPNSLPNAETPPPTADEA